MHQHKKIEQTQNRFLHIAQTLKDSTFKFPEKGNGGFDISQYLMNMSKYTRTREGLFWTNDHNFQIGRAYFIKI